MSYKPLKSAMNYLGDVYDGFSNLAQKIGNSMIPSPGLELVVAHAGVPSEHVQRGNAPDNRYSPESLTMGDGRYYIKKVRKGDFANGHISINKIRKNKINRTVTVFASDRLNYSIGLPGELPGETLGGLPGEKMGLERLKNYVTNYLSERGITKLDPGKVRQIVGFLRSLQGK